VAIGATSYQIYKLLELAINICKKNNAPVLMLLIDIQGTRLDRVRDLLEQSQTEFVKLPSRTESPELYYEIDGHWNKKGHALAAEKVMKTIRSTNQRR
jgi:hypothetical protein